MRYLSLFSGIEAATVAWEPLGWECVAVAEIAPFPCAVLKHHYPHVPNLGSVTEITEEDIKRLGHIDLIVFGSPCQDLSVAGKRKGLAGERSGLFHVAIDIVEWARRHCGARWALWENVPGAFTSNSGRDFAAVVEHMAGLEELPVPAKGWGTEGVAVGQKGMVEWAVLDAQWFGVAQRRRRVFALADFGDWSGRPPILLESEGLRGDSAPSREARKDTTYDVAPCLTGSGRGVERAGDTRGQDPIVACEPVLVPDVSRCLNAGGMGRIDYETETMLACSVGGAVAHTLKAEGFDASEDGTGRGTPSIAVNSNAQPDEMKFDPHVTAPLTCSQNSAIAFSCKDYGADVGEVGPTLRAMGRSESHPNGGGQVAIVSSELAVRRLTPVECERLQGFPDNYTRIPWKLGYWSESKHSKEVREAVAEQCPDGPRYKALGNSMAVPVMRWIGSRIDFALLW